MTAPPPDDFLLTAYDEAVIAAVLASDASPADQRALLLMHNRAMDYASDDPGVWSQARAVNARLQALERQRERGLLDAAADAEQTRRALTGCGLDCWLAVLHLQRCQAVAFGHALRHGLTRN